MLSYRVEKGGGLRAAGRWIGAHRRCCCCRSKAIEGAGSQIRNVRL
jgi:hypothetical protein